MTNVPGVGFIVFLVALVSAALVAIAGFVALLAHAALNRPFWQSMGGAYVGVGLVAGLTFLSQWGLSPIGLGTIAVGGAGYLVGGVLFYAVPISPATLAAYALYDDVGWDEAVHYATIGWVTGLGGGAVIVVLAGLRLPSVTVVGVGFALVGILAGGPLAAKLLRKHGGSP